MPYMVVVSEWGVERDCRTDVRDAGFVTYQPQAREAVVRRGRKTWAERLLLGRYFFAKWTEDCHWRSLFNLRRVNGVFMRVDANLPALVRDEEVQRFRDREDKSGFVKLDEELANQFVRGQRVRAQSGVMVGIVGDYVGVGRGGCDVATLDLFGQPTRVEFRPGVLAAA